MNKRVVASKTRNVAVEIPLHDGSASLLIGKVIKRTKDGIFLREASYVAATGRRSEFFAGRFDANVEIEPYPDDMEIELPAARAQIYSWNHALPRAVR